MILQPYAVASTFNSSQSKQHPKHQVNQQQALPAQPTLNISSDSSYITIGKHFSFYEDAKSDKDITQILTPELASHFIPSKQKVFNFGFSKSTYWAKAQIKNTEDISNRRFLEVAYPLLDNISVYVVDTEHRQSQQITKQWHLGDSVKYELRPISHINFVFPVDFEPHQQLTIIIKMASTGPVSAPINLYTEKDYRQHSANFELYSGLFFGMLLSMIFYNLFIFIATRDTSYFFYVCSICAQFAFAFVMYGHANKYWFANATHLSFYAPSVFMCLSCMTAILFCQRFLQLKEFMPKSNRALNILNISLGILLMVLFLFLPDILISGMVMSTAFVLPALSLVVIARMRHGFHPAQYLLFAWTVPILGFSLRALASFGILPFNDLTIYCSQIGVAIEVIILSLALADRIRVLQKQAKEKDHLAKYNAEKAKLNAEKANRSKSIFIANVSHEIRTPLNIILGYSQMINRRPDLPKPIGEKIEIIENSGQHLLKLINDILDISKIEANAMTLNSSDFDLCELADGLSIMFGGRCDVKKLKWRYSNECGKSELVNGDIGKLRQILINLLGNAVKFTQTGFIHFKLSSPKQGHYCFEVIDTGIGIDEHHIKEIFRAFGQTQQGAKLGGTGLGLAIAHQQIKLMGGELSCQSQLRQGSHFKFTIELPPALKPVTPRAQRLRRVHKLPDNIHLTAMVVDDTKANRDILCHILQEAGLNITEAQNGQQALEKLHQAQKLPDLIFLDIRMPIMDGVETLNHIKQDFAGCCPVCIVITAHALRHDIDHYIKQGFDHYIAKPFRFEAVYDCIHQLMGIDFQTVQSAQLNDLTPQPEDIDEPPEEPESTKEPVVTELPNAVIIDDALFELIIETAQDHEIAKLTAALEELARKGPKSQVLSQVLNQYVLQYDMSGLIHLIQSVRLEHSKEQ